ncbi:MAG: hypothetical protein RL757_2314 [Bacteroidota bacterium]|jgi:DNA replication and repair protein RecF
MYLKKLLLTNFKNYESLRLDLHERVNAFVGLNGGGKTNVLDAIFYLCMCKSYFQHLDADIITKPLESDQKPADFMRLEGFFERNGRKERIVAKIQARKKKVFERNDAPYPSLSEHVGLLPVVIVAPDDVQLATEGSEERRRFIDTTLSQMDNKYLNYLILYNKIVEQRNALLKKWLSERNDTGGSADTALLDVYDAQLRAPTAYIFKSRQAFIADFSPIFNEIYQKISDNRENVVVTYESRLKNDIDFLEILKAARQKDLILGRTSVGIHRDDLGFEIDKKPLKKFGSQGQLKSFVVSLKLAQHQILAKNELQISPILLLDDIFDKLDDQRIENLLQLLAQQRIGQIFLTDTHPERTLEVLTKLGVPFQIFNVAAAKVQKMPSPSIQAD